MADKHGPVWSFTDTELYHLRALLSDIFWRMDPIETGPGVSVHPPLDVPTLLSIFEEKLGRLKDKEMDKLESPDAWPSLKREYEPMILITRDEYNRLKYGSRIDNG